jgi:hypothetical protein
MKSHLTILVLNVLFALAGRADQIRFSLMNGTIKYVDESGASRRIEVGAKCVDLWVSPDESLISFIAITKERLPVRSPRLPYEEKPFIEESNIYIARRADQFNPVRLPVPPPIIAGRSWSVIRHPIVSPDQKMVFFDVPYTMTTSKLFRLNLQSGVSEMVGDATNYCVIWNGKLLATCWCKNDMCHRTFMRVLPTNAS